MAVYTHLSSDAIAAFLGAYDVGDLVSAKGIAEGVSNSNWLIETTAGRYILTVYESRTPVADLPFYLALLDHLAQTGNPVPQTIHDRSGAAFRMVAGKPAALIEFLPGLSIDTPSPAQARSVGEALAGLHRAVRNFPLHRPQAMGLAAWGGLIAQCPPEGLAAIDPALPGILDSELAYLAENWPAQLPGGVVHGDLFPDNVLFAGARVSGLIDFYFAADDYLAYDLAVTHAAWCFEGTGAHLRRDVSAALLAGYGGVRPLSAAERAAMPVLLRGACVRFLATRAYDWIFTPREALVVRKDPREFLRRLEFYRANADGLLG